jgi:hypothetical protein
MKTNIKEEEILSDFKVEALCKNSLASNVLFYPCAGDDFLDAIFYFYPIIDTFFFCDLRSNYTSLIRSKEIKAILPDFDLLKSISECLWKKNIDDRPNKKQIVTDKERLIETPLYIKTQPIKLTQIWKNEKENKKIRIIWVEGDGYKVLSSEEILKQIGIFFYRGDSYGEGGSDVRWLETEKDRDYCYHGSGKHFNDVLQRIKNKCLIVTDGSNCGEEYKFLKQYHNSGDLSFPMIKDVPKDGISFRCLGKITQRYGPTLVWQIEKDKG